MTALRNYLKQFLLAAAQRGRDGLHRQPAVRVAIDALEAVALGAVDELFDRLPQPPKKNKPRARARPHT